jgi:SNF2 family DNA or RNA helicase
VTAQPIDLDVLLDPLAARRARGLQLKATPRVELPPLKYWNYGPCSHHESPRVECEWRECGGPLFTHQEKSVAWHYLTMKGIEASVTGAGKTGIVLGLSALIKERHPEQPLRTLVVSQAPAVLQWAAEAQRFVPGIQSFAVTADDKPAKRKEKYATTWELLFISQNLLIRDLPYIEQAGPLHMVADDLDTLLNPSNKTHQAFVRLADQAERTTVLNATNLQTHLRQLYSASVPIGGARIWGSMSSFDARFVQEEESEVWVPQKKLTEQEKASLTPEQLAKRKKAKQIITHKTVGYKNLNTFKQQFEPLFIRHSYADLGVSMPEIMPPVDVWLDLHPAQRARYTQLQTGVMELLRPGAPKLSLVDARLRFGYGQQICAGLPALKEPDGKEASVKLDWLMWKLTGEWSDQKIVVFFKNTGMIYAFQERLRKAGIGQATVWGEETNSLKRKAEQDRFWQDPQCRVFMGTSNILVYADSYLNPARMTQLLGRIRRPGEHKHVFIFNLLCRGTQEEKYATVQAARQALIDAVWEEDNAQFEKLSPEALLQLIQP